MYFKENKRIRLAKPKKKDSGKKQKKKKRNERKD
jgi:hypothetical protein